MHDGCPAHNHNRVNNINYLSTVSPNKTIGIISKIIYGRPYLWTLIILIIFIGFLRIKYNYLTRQKMYTFWNPSFADSKFWPIKQI